MLRILKLPALVGLAPSLSFAREPVPQINYVDFNLLKADGNGENVRRRDVLALWNIEDPHGYYDDPSVIKFSKKSGRLYRKGHGTMVAALERGRIGSAVAPLNSTTLKTDFTAAFASG